MVSHFALSFAAAAAQRWAKKVEGDNLGAPLLQHSRHRDVSVHETGDHSVSLGVVVPRAVRDIGEHFAIAAFPQIGGESIVNVDVLDVKALERV